METDLSVGTIVQCSSRTIIPLLIRNYEEYPAMSQYDKWLLEESDNIHLIPHYVPSDIYGVIIEDHSDPPGMNNKWLVDWAAEYHLKFYDNSKNTDKLFWGSELWAMKWTNDTEIYDNERVLSNSFRYNHEYLVWERKEFRYKCWYCGEEGCDRMLVLDRLSILYSDLFNNATIDNNQRRYNIYQAMLGWFNVMMGRRPLREMCECVIMEVAEYFPVEETGSEYDESDEECDSSGVIDLIE